MSSAIGQCLLRPDHHSRLSWYFKTHAIAFCAACSWWGMAGWLPAADGSAPLADALRRQHTELVEELLENPANFYTAQPDGMTPLHWATQQQLPDVVRRLLAGGVDPNVANRYGVSPLSIACTNGDGEIVEMLLAAGANANAALPGGETPLMTAARTGKLKPVQALIARGADVNARERKGQTALMWAAAEGNVEAVDALIKAGADPLVELPSGFNAFFFAIRNGQQDVVQRLLKAGMDVNQAIEPRKANNQGLKAGTTPLLLAIENGHFALAIALLEAGANPNENRRGYTPLHAITWVRKPLRGDGDPPPFGSGTVSSLQFVRVLVERGADVNARHGPHKPAGGALNKTEATPFLLAAETGDLPLLKLLLKLGADPDLCNLDDCTPLLAATGVGILSNGDESAGTEDEAIEVVRWLLTLGADINAVDKLGNSALHGATFENRSQLLEFLAEQGADVNIWYRPNSRRWTPLDIAYGQRPGNFRPNPESLAVLQRLLQAAGIEAPPPPPGDDE